MLLQKHSQTNFTESLKAFSAIILLLLYGIGNIPVALIHQFVHAHDAVVAHTIEQEKDPCHLSIYHAYRDGSCHHETHVTKVEKCNLCHLIFHNDQIVLSSSTSQFIQSFCFINDRVVSALLRDITDQLPSRAPPFLSALAS
jgi:hypothetical protein